MNVPEPCCFFGCQRGNEKETEDERAPTETVMKQGPAMVGALG